MKPKAYTIVELIIVITIILILAAAAVSGTGGIIRNLRFGNTFNKMILMVQQARSNAITGKDNVEAYGIYIPNQTTFQIFSGTTTAPLETLTAPINLYFSAKKGAFSCGETNITFTSVTTETSITTDTTIKCNNDDEVKQLEISLCSDATCTDTNKKSFLINKAAGIPQVQ